jgi:hypothetical protein
MQETSEIEVAEVLIQDLSRGAFPFFKEKIN